jgi:hypothetical protein
MNTDKRLFPTFFEQPTRPYRRAAKTGIVSKGAEGPPNGTGAK